MPDRTDDILASVAEAHGTSRPLRIRCNNSKHYLCRETEAGTLAVNEHAGIIDYEPTELVLTARSGTTIADINRTLDEHQQCLAFEPPEFGGVASLGGTIACGLSGPARPWTGAARDFVLGTTIINGKGELLRFGGRVMKNVAGYDVSRLMVGAYGGLGVLLDISLKVLPASRYVRTVALEMRADQAIEQVNAWAGTPLPLSAACWYDGTLSVRFSGTKSGVDNAVRRLGGDIVADQGNWWDSIRDYTHPFFRQPGRLWRLSVPPASPMPDIAGEWLVDWGGAQRWLRTEAPAETVIELTVEAGGHALGMNSQEADIIRPALAENMASLHKTLKQAFDPAGILNPGILYEDL